MKKVAFIIIMMFLLIALSDLAYAKTDTEYETALMYYNSGNYEEAVRLFKEYVSKKPDPSAYYYIAYALYKLREFDEASKYFKEAYLVDPLYTPMTPEIVKRMPEKKRAKILGAPIEKEPSIKAPEVAERIEKEPEVPPVPIPEKPPVKEMQPQIPKEPAPQVIVPEKIPMPEPQKIEPPQTVQPPAGLPPITMPGKGMPEIPLEGMLGALLAGFMTIILIVQIAVYIYFALCLFLIAKKLDVRAAWTAFIPIVQIYTIMASAGKPLWWILLLLIPIVNIFIAIYIWMCITENLGKNKWLGLLMMLPIINFVFIGILAFSRAEKGYAGVKVPA